MLGLECLSLVLVGHKVLPRNFAKINGRFETEHVYAIVSVHHTDTMMYNGLMFVSPTLSNSYVT